MIVLSSENLWYGQYCITVAWSAHASISWQGPAILSKHQNWSSSKYFYLFCHHKRSQVVKGLQNRTLPMIPEDTRTNSCLTYKTYCYGRCYKRKHFLCIVTYRISIVVEWPLHPLLWCWQMNSDKYIVFHCGWRLYYTTLLWPQTCFGCIIQCC